VPEWSASHDPATEGQESSPEGAVEAASSAKGREGAPIALVTGATSGIGRACALALAQAGYRVYGTGRNPTRNEVDPRIYFIPLDVSKDASVESLRAALLGREGRLDLLVASAGMGVAGAVEETPVADAARQLDVNFLGTVRTVKAFLPTMREHRSGRIIVIGSLAGRIGMPFQAFYSAGKFALEGFVESLRHELRPFGIQVCIVEPGDFHTGFTGSRTKTTTAPGSAYEKSFVRTIDIQEKDERSGADPSLAAQLIVSLAKRRRMPLRVSVGPIFQRFAAGIKHFMPGSWFEKLYKIYYKLD
jgi:NAD(P)-dependent dehydrogenase (short-subunit alcohol dehydrogenase family)